MLPFTRFEAGYSRLGCTNTLCNFSLCDTCGGASFEKLVKKLKLFVQSIVFGFYVCALKSACFKFFVS